MKLTLKSAIYTAMVVRGLFALAILYVIIHFLRKVW